mmetsp:Transcript_24499/g.58699  ORF Transcript_24499/g.58699 Transcript_24499/m.58699 type:complete len:131 (-) Transcript_24499:228-620(-)
MLYRLVCVALVASCQAFVLPSNVGAVAVRTEGVSPMMFGGGGKAKPAAKKVAKKVVKKAAPKKVVKKVVKKAAPKKVVRKAGVQRGGSKTNVGASAQSFSSKIVSKENWLVQAVGLLGNLGKSQKKYDQL